MEKVLQTWLSHQCRMLTGVIHAVLLIGPPDERKDNRAFFWPDKQQDNAVLFRVSQAAWRSRKTVIKNRNNTSEKTGEPLDAVACPVFLKDRLFGVVAIEMTTRSEAMQQAAVQQVQAGTKWLEIMVMLHRAAGKEQLVNLVDLVAVGLDNEQFKHAAFELTNELAKRFSCLQVSLGMLRYNRIRIEAVSHSSRIDRHSNLIRAIREAMSESLDQKTTIVYPVKSDNNVLITRFHSQLAKTRQGMTICTLPLIKNGKAIGAILLERSADKPFASETVEQCEQIGSLLGPVLETRMREERSFFLKILEYLQSRFVKLFGPRHLPLKIAISLTAALLVWFSLASSIFRISSDSVLEAEVCRSVVAPQKGYILAANVRAGDMVHEGDLLATLDDKELRLQQRKWESQLAQLFKEYRQALAGSDRAEIAIINAKRSQAEAQLDMVEQQLGRTNLIAPFAGLIVKGDLSQALGSPVARGDVLYEVAPTDKYRVVLKVDDRDIRLVSPGQRGQLKLSGIPDQSIDITVDRLTPVSSTEGGRNYFRVEAAMDKHSDLMRPGMEGIARIEIGREKLIWILSRRLIDWVRLFVWNRLP